MPWAPFPTLWMALFDHPQEAYPCISREHHKKSRKNDWTPWECILCMYLHGRQTCRKREERHSLSGGSWQADLNDEQATMDAVDARRYKHLGKLWHDNALGCDQDESIDDGHDRPSRSDAVEYEFAGRGTENAFRDLRSPRKARRRRRDESERYFNYRGAVRRGDLGSLVHVPDGCIPFPFKGLVRDSPVTTMTKAMLYHEAQLYPRPPKRHRQAKREDEGWRLRGWGTGRKGLRLAARPVKEEEAAWAGYRGDEELDDVEMEAVLNVSRERFCCSDCEARRSADAPEGGERQFSLLDFERTSKRGSQFRGRRRDQRQEVRRQRRQQHEDLSRSFTTLDSSSEANEWEFVILDDLFDDDNDDDAFDIVDDDEDEPWEILE